MREFDMTAIEAAFEKFSDEYRQFMMDSLLKANTKVHEVLYQAFHTGSCKGASQMYLNELVRQVTTPIIEAYDMVWTNTLSYSPYVTIFGEQVFKVFGQ